MNNAIYEIFNPAELSQWPGQSKEIVDEAVATLMGYLRPQHIIDEIGEYHYSDISPETRKLIVRCLNRLTHTLPLLIKRAKKYTDSEIITDDGIVRTMFFQLMTDASLRFTGYNLATGDAPIEQVANSINLLSAMIEGLREKINERKTS